MTKKLLSSVATLALLVATTTNVAAQTLDQNGRPVHAGGYQDESQHYGPPPQEPAPQEQANPLGPGMPEAGAVFVIDGQRGFDNLPVAAEPHTTQGVVKFSRDHYMQVFGRIPGAAAKYASLEDASRQNCVEANDQMVNLADGMQLLAETDPMMQQIFEKYHVDLRKDMKTAQGTRHVATFFSFLLGILSAIGGGPVGAAYGGRAITGGIADEASGHESDDAMRFARRASMINAVHDQIWTRFMIIWGGQDRWWLRKVLPDCFNYYPYTVRGTPGYGSLPRLDFAPVRHQVDVLEHED